MSENFKSTIEFFIEPGGILDDGTPVEADGYSTVLIATVNGEQYSASAGTPVDVYESLDAEGRDRLKLQLFKDVAEGLMLFLKRKILKDVYEKDFNEIKDALRKYQKEFVC